MDGGQAGEPAFRAIRIAARDGLRLAVRDYRPLRPMDAPPVLCLAGLTRNAKDFHALALDLQAHGHRVVCLDSRGRGRSERDSDWRRYHPIQEANDVLAVTDALGLHHYAVIGTSRGGLLAMALTAIRPGPMTRVVLNDIGPVIEAAGLARIKAYLGRAVAPSDWGDAVRIVREAGAGTFPNRSDADWREIALATFAETPRGLAPDFDPKLLKTLEDLDLSGPPPSLWPQFMGLRGIPVLAIRGALSDLLGPETLKAMERRHPRCRTLTVPGVGHTPSLVEPGVPDAIRAFLTE